MGQDSAVFVPASRFIRYSNTLLGVIVAGFGVLAGASGYEGPADVGFVVAIAAVGLVAGAVLVMRSLSLGVSCEPQAFVVRGLFRNRRIPLDAVRRMPGPESVGTLPWIAWTSPRLPWRATPLTAFWVSGPFAPLVSAEPTRALLRLHRHWKHHRSEGVEGHPVVS